MMLYLLLPLALDVKLPPGPGPVTNPLKGYAPYVESPPPLDVPFTMAYHYATWRELEPKEGEFAFDAWEAKTFRAGLSKARRVVLRVQMDYPNQPVGVPAWLIAKGVKMNPYDDKEVGKGLSPDYADPRFRASLRRLIAAMGKRWNGNPQVGYVQLGLLGHWGEWHTWPREELFAPPEVQKEVVDAMRAAFPDKPLMARTATGTLARPWMGYHDDMIPDDTMGAEEWKWIPNLTANGRKEAWKVAPTGGEMVPFAAERLLGKDWPTTLRAVEEGHLTWIGPYCPLLVDSKDATFKARAAELSRRLGYEFRLTRLKVEGSEDPLGGSQPGRRAVLRQVAPALCRHRHQGQRADFRRDARSMPENGCPDPSPSRRPSPRISPRSRPPTRLRSDSSTPGWASPAFSSPTPCP